MSINSDSEDDDSDYAPELEEDKNDEDEENTDTTLKTIPFSRKRKACALWDEMVQKDLEESANAMTRAVHGNISPPTFKQSKRIKKLLRTVFGITHKKLKVIPFPSNTKSLSDIERIEDIRSKARASVNKLQKKQTITETRKFAGQSITIERTVTSTQGTVGTDSSSSSTNAFTSTAPPPTSASVSAPPTAVAPAPSALDKVLDELKGPKTVSTVMKSSYDWDSFKEQEGLEDELAVASKEGYLKRKEFLERCDVREYVNERDARTKPTH